MNNRAIAVGGWQGTRPDGDAIIIRGDIILLCHLCDQRIQAPDGWAALLTLAQHYDMQHRGWTDALNNGEET